MKGKLLLLACFASVQLFAQSDSTTKPIKPGRVVSGKETSSVFRGQRLINAMTVEVLHKGVMAFNVIHTFGDVAGDNGGIKNFYGLDGTADAEIGFQVGLCNHLNIVLNHIVGGLVNGRGRVEGLGHLYEGGLKYQFMDQDDQKPFSLTAYGNVVSTAETLIRQDSAEQNFGSSSDRLSELLQLMAARKFGQIGVQISGTFLHTNYVVPGDQNNLLSIGGAIRIPITHRFFIISDYFHSFRTAESKQTWTDRGATPRDVFGVGVEILTSGHIFHLNFTNARNILENRFLPRTSESWGKGQFRWGFTLTRNFTIFRVKQSN